MAEQRQLATATEVLYFLPAHRGSRQTCPASGARCDVSRAVVGDAGLVSRGPPKAKALGHRSDRFSMRGSRIQSRPASSGTPEQPSSPGVVKRSLAVEGSRRQLLRGRFRGRPLLLRLDSEFLILICKLCLSWLPLHSSSAIAR